MANFTLNVPQEMVAVAQRIAEANAQPIEEVFLDRLKNALPLPVLPPDEEAELAALSHLSEDALWTIATEQMPEPLQLHLQELMEKNSLGAISPDEYQELENLVDRGQRLMLRKSEAAAILTRRGFKVTAKDLMSRA